MNKVQNTFESLGYTYDNKLLETSYKEALKDDTFKKIVDELDFDKKMLMKFTSVLQDCSIELKNCQNCKNILECKNKLTGYCYLPLKVDNNLNFNYEACVYKKELDDKNKYIDNMYLYKMPKEIKEAKMKDIFLTGTSRIPIIKWLKNFILNYNEESKGLYLSGNFGCGKTYLIAATFNELAKKNVKSAIIYWPEFLRDLKGSFDNGYNEKYDYIKNIPLLLIDDIGAEGNTSFSRDEILGTILQYRMQEHKTTFFTSNLNLNELEEHFAVNKNNMEVVKAKRIIERINQLTEKMEMIGDNLRK